MDYDSEGGHDDGAVAAAADEPVVAGLSTKQQQALDLVNNAGAPVFESTPAGFHLVLKETIFGTYACVHTIAFDEGTLMITCCLPKDGGGVCSKKTRISFGNRIEYTNAMTHLRSVHKTFVRPEHKAASAAELAAAASSSSSSASAAGAGVVTEASEAEIAKEKSALLHLVACGGLPVAICRNPGFMYYQRIMNRPTISLTTFQRYVADSRPGSPASTTMRSPRRCRHRSFFKQQAIALAPTGEVVV